jgi:ribA/ribD-fused uncharacterized protein
MRSKTGAIISFDGEERFLSNFWPVKVSLDGLEYNSVEAAYQAAKTLNMHQRMPFQTMTPSESKKAGRLLVIRPDWDEVKEQVMYSLLVQKFMPDTDLAEKLLATGYVPLVEGNTWGDIYWGVCNGQGLNRLGNLLADVRTSLRERKDNMTTVVNVKTDVPDVYIGRAWANWPESAWGNPFHTSQTGNREVSIAAFRAYFFHRLYLEPEFATATRALAGKRLGCWCKPESCHGDVIKEWLDLGGKDVKYYTGIGNHRNVPEEILALMTQIAGVLRTRGYILRSGGAPQSDQAFELGAGNMKDIIVPDVSYAGQVWSPGYPMVNKTYIAQARQILLEIMPEVAGWKENTQRIFERNVPQPLGRSLNTHSKFTIFYSAEDPVTRVVDGGTRCAVYVGRKFNIPEYNLYFGEVREKLKQQLGL